MQIKESVNHLPEAFTKAFVAAIFFRGSFHGICFLKLPRKNILFILSTVLCTSVEASVEANLLPRKRP